MAKSFLMESILLMKSGIISIITLVTVSWSFALAQSRDTGHVVPDPEALRNGWIFSLKEGESRARQSGKPIMVVLRCNP